MASIRKTGDRWRAEVRQAGKYHSKTFATKKDARAWAASVEAQIERPAGSGPETVRDGVVYPCAQAGARYAL